MALAQTIRRWLGGGEDDETYRCIRCSAEFERNYRECPSCGLPYVTEVSSGPS